MFPLHERKLIRGFQAHIDAGLGGAADYVANYVQLRAPFDGTIETYQGTEGGNWLRLRRGSGDYLQFAHLDSYKVVSGSVLAGQPLAITGNTGTVTSGPHLHTEVYIDSKRVDPEQYNFMNSIPITVIGQGFDYALFDNTLRAQVEKWSKGNLTVDFTHIMIPVAYPLGQDEAYAMRLQFCPQDRFVLFACTPGPEIYKTFGTAAGDAAIIVGGLDNLTNSYEVSHALNVYYNANRGSNPYIEVEDTVGGVTDEQRYHKYEKLMPYMGLILGPRPEKTMTEQEVRQLQALEGYSDEPGVQYWKGKQLADYLKARLADKVKTIQNVQ